jgi:glycerol dehydrogenase-like iron-containing ADH family enzyme
MLTTTLTPYTVGLDALDVLGELFPRGERLLAIGGKTALEKAEPALALAAGRAGLTLLEPQWYGGQCTRENMEALAAKGKTMNPQGVLGVGGGKAIDTAKGVARRLGLPLVTVPTIAATCAGVTRLSVVYRQDGSFEGFDFYPRPPLHCIIPTGIIAQAPVRYLRAGMGDAIAKHLECTMASRGDDLNHASAMGVAVSAPCLQIPLALGKAALEDCTAGETSPALEQVVLANIVTTGMVASLVDEAYNGAVAHSVFYGLTTVPGLEETHLHGDVVAYGVLVQTALDQKEELTSLGTALAGMGFPVSLGELGLDLNGDDALLETALKSALEGPDMEHLPYAVTLESLKQAVAEVEKRGFSQGGYLHE